MNLPVNSKSSASKIFTIPNILSMVRLLMIPLLIYSYIGMGNMGLTSILLILSGLTDIADGMIARRFNMTSDLGKALDPVADKLTQASVMFCLATDHPAIRIPLGLLIVKEATTGAAALIAIHKSHRVEGAQLHGKASTVLIEAMMILHLLWKEMPLAVSNVLIAMCVIMMLYSFVMYMHRSINTVREESE